MIRQPPPSLPSSPPPQQRARSFTWPWSMRKNTRIPCINNYNNSQDNPTLLQSRSKAESVVSETGSCTVINLDDEDFEVFTTAEAPILVSTMEVNEEIQIRMVNLERWRIQPMIFTLDFQIVSPELESSYEAMAQEMKAFYEGTQGGQYEFSRTLLKERSMDVAVVQTSDGEFKRVLILRLADSERWERNPEEDEKEDFRIQLIDGASLSDDDSDHKDERNDGSTPSADESTTADYRVVLADENVNLRLKSSDTKWYYLMQRFCRLPFRTHQCFLTDTGLVQDLDEFRDEAVQIFAEADVIECRVDRINKNNVRFVTLKSAKWSDTINEVLCIKTIEAFPPASVPPVGQSRSGASLSHCNDNGEVFLQFKNSYIFKLFRRIAAGLKEDKYLEAKAKGPHALHHNKFYLAPYDGWYYRCHIVGPIIPESLTVTIIFSDYGNSDERPKSELVPCADVDEEFNAFPKQAVRVHLRNIGGVRWEVVMEHLKENATFVVETMTERTTERVECVELLSTIGLETMMLSESLLESKFAVRWSDELMGPPLLYTHTQALSVIPSIIPMRTTNWAADDTKIVLAEPGAIIEVIVREVDAYGIRAATIYAQKRLAELQGKIRNWYYWKHVQEMSQKTYVGFIRESIEMGNVLLMTGSIGRPKPSELVHGSREVFHRVRVLRWKGEDALIVYNVDDGTKEVCGLSSLHPIDVKFCELPAQGATLNINGFEELLKERHVELNLRMRDAKYLVKVENVTYEAMTERCHISGRIFHFSALRSRGNPNFPLGVSQSMSPGEAENIDLGEPLTARYYLDELPPSNFHDECDLSPMSLAKAGARLNGNLDWIIK